MKKKIILGILCICMSCVCGCGKVQMEADLDIAQDEVEPEVTEEVTHVTIGISQYADTENLNDCREGFIQGLKTEGLVDGENITLVTDYAHLDDTMSERIAENYLEKEVDMIVTFGNQTTISAHQTCKDTKIPVIFSAFSEPVRESLKELDGTILGEITGVSTPFPVKRQLEMIREILPNCAKIGVLYQENKVADSLIAEYKRQAESLGFSLVQSKISSTTNVSEAVEKLADETDCITSLDEDWFGKNIETVLETANKKKKPVFGNDSEQVEKGCLAAIVLDYNQVGEQTAAMATRIIKKELTASELNYETINAQEEKYNQTVASRLGIESSK